MSNYDKLHKMIDDFMKLAQDSRHHSEWRSEMPSKKTGPGPGLTEYNPGDFNKLRALAEENRKFRVYLGRVTQRKRQIAQEWRAIMKRNRLTDAEITQILNSKST